MSVSPGPFITCLITALVLNVYILFIIHVKKDILYEGMRFTFSVIVLILLRMMIPLNFPFTITIPFAGILPLVNRLLYYNVGGGNIQICHILVTVWVVEAVRRLLLMCSANREYRRFLAPFKVKNISDYPEVLELLKEYELSSLPVYMVPATVSPELFGAWNTVLVLPKDMLSKEELNFACRHELEHYRNHDLWLKLFVDLALCIQWFNPLVNLLQMELILAFEMSNDRKVLHGCTEKQRMNYVLSIVRISKMLKGSPVKQRGLSFTKLHDFNTKQRIHFLSSEEYGKTKRRGVSIFFRYILVIVMLVVSFVFVPEGYNDEGARAVGGISLGDDNSYLIKCKEGYQWYVDGVYMYTFSTIHEGFDDLPIFEEEVE